MKEKLELKSCPFCGSDIVSCFHCDFYGIRYWQVKCFACNATFSPHPQGDMTPEEVKAELYKLWNRRADS